MKRVQLRRTEFQRLRIDGCGEKVDRIPDAPGLEDTVRACQSRHRYAARQSTLQTGGYRVRMQREPGPDLIGRHRKAVDHAAVRDHSEIVGNYGHGYFMLAR